MRVGCVSCTQGGARGLDRNEEEAMNGSWLRGALVALVALAMAQPARAEVDEVHVAKQYGVGYLPIMVMQDHKLIEKHAKALGLGDIRVTWNTLTDGTAMNDALLSGNLDLASGGIGSFVVLWARTRDTLKVKSLGALDSMPAYLNTTNPNIRSIKDFSPNDRISLPGVKVSPQAITLQRAAAQAYGAENYAKLDPLTVNMSHPVGMQALLSGAGQITAHFTSPPFQYEELKHPGVHTVLSTYDVWGGPQTFICTWTTSKFKEANPKTYQAMVAAIGDAIAWINHDKRGAAELYVRMTKGKESVDDIMKILEDPLVEYTETPKNVMKFVEFKNEIGTLKAKPASWKDMFFDNVHHLPGS
jgi:NitT/TauT family transport system substrate-binding protein